MTKSINQNTRFSSNLPLVLVSGQRAVMKVVLWPQYFLNPRNIYNPGAANVKGCQTRQNWALCHISVSGWFLLGFEQP